MELKLILKALQKQGQQKNHVEGSYLFVQTKSIYISLPFLNCHYFQMGKSVQWAWIDSNCMNSQNTLLFQTFELLDIWIKRYTHFQTFRSDIKKQEPNTVVNIICSATLESEAYRFFDEENKVEDVALYCFKRQHGTMIRQNFHKINRVIVQDERLINYVLSVNKWKEAR